jgi:hypothetical protein
LDYATVSAKIPRKLKGLLDKYGIRPSPIIRRALEEEVKRRMLGEIEERAKRLSGKVSHIPDDEFVRLIREDRDR